MHSRTTVEDHGSTGQGKHALLCEQLPSVIVDPCLYYCCIAHQALAALLFVYRGLCKNRLIIVGGRTQLYLNCSNSTFCTSSDRVFLVHAVVQTLFFESCCTVHVKKTCPNLHAEWSSCSPRITLHTPMHVNRTVLAQRSVHREQRAAKAWCAVQQ